MQLSGDIATFFRLSNGEELCSKYIIVSECYFPIIEAALNSVRDDLSGRAIFLYNRAGKISDVFPLDMPMPVHSGEEHEYEKTVEVPNVPSRPAYKRPERIIAPSAAQRQDDTEDVKNIMARLECNQGDIDNVFVGTMPLCVRWEALQACKLDEELLDFLSAPESARHQPRRLDSLKKHGCGSILLRTCM